jgi:tetratricopeptide (TPR) repeat protein
MNDETRMTNDEEMTKSEFRIAHAEMPALDMRAPSSLTHSSFVMLHFCTLVLFLLTAARAATPSTGTNALSQAPESPREFFNAGTEQMREGKLREAETFLQSAVSSQDARVQPPALYNLGHVRNAQGEAELKKSPEARATANRGRTAAAQAEAAVNLADAAIADQNVQRLIESYLRGRGARRELRDAMRQVLRAMELHAAALLRWQRAAGDFKSAVELNPADTNAQHNADVMDRKIAQLVDRLQQMQQAAMTMAEQNRRLGERLRQMRGMIPEPMMPPGAAGDEEEDEDMPMGLRQAQVEPPGREGDERPISPEEAMQLLEGFKLDGNRRLPMGQGDQAEPKDRKRSNW